MLLPGHRKPFGLFAVVVVILLCKDYDLLYCDSIPLLSPIYTMKNRCDMRCDKLCDRGNPVAGCCKLLQRLIAKVEPGSTFATACIATWDAT